LVSLKELFLCCQKEKNAAMTVIVASEKNVIKSFTNIFFPITQLKFFLYLATDKALGSVPAANMRH
jgi:hypothetical protein